MNGVTALASPASKNPSVAVNEHMYLTTIGGGGPESV
jgi:hypothetical protein